MPTAWRTDADYKAIVSTPQAEVPPEPQTTQDSDSKEVQEISINGNGEDSHDDDMSEGFDQSEGFEEAGDDFDDFEEGGQEDDDFDDFDDGFQQAEPVPTPTQTTLPVLPVLPFVSPITSHTMFCSFSQPV